MGIWAVYCATKLDEGQFGFQGYHLIGQSLHMLVGYFADNTNCLAGLYPIHMLKQVLNPPGQFACRPYTRFFWLINRLEYIYNVY